MPTIGERIAELRRKSGMTQEELASLLGISAQSVSKWETGVTMPDILLLAITSTRFSGKRLSPAGKYRQTALLTWPAAA